MGLSEGARAIYGVPLKGAEASLGSWYDHFYGSSRSVNARRQAVQSAVARQTALPDPGMVNTTGRGGATRVGRARPARRGTTTRGQGALDASNPAFQAALQQRQAIVAQSGIDPQTGLPNYYQNAAAPGIYQEQQALRQEAQGLYTEAHMRDPGNWSPESISQLQRELVKAGIITSRFHMGVFDKATQEGYATLLSLANENGGKTKNEMLAQLVATNPDDLMSMYRKPKFVAPDRNALVEDVEQVFQQRLGRTPTSEERKHLIQQYQREFRREFQLETLPTARGEFIGGAFNEAQQQLGLAPELPTVQDVDPGARFASYFRKRYRNEENEIQRRDDRAEQGQTAMKAFDELRSMMGAGGVQQLGG